MLTFGLSMLKAMDTNTDGNSNRMKSSITTLIAIGQRKNPHFAHGNPLPAMYTTNKPCSLSKFGCTPRTPGAGLPHSASESPL